MKIKNVIAVVLVIVFSVLVFWWRDVTDRRSEGTVKYLIGIAHSDINEAWQLAFHEEAKAYVDGLPDVGLVTTNANGTTYKQMKDIGTLIDYGVDVLIVTPNDSVVIKDRIAEVYGSVPIVVMGNYVTGDGYDLYIGPDYYQTGAMSAESTALLLQEGDMTDARLIEIRDRLEIIQSNLISDGISASLPERIQMLSTYSYDGTDKDFDKLLDRYQRVRQDSDIMLFHNYSIYEKAENYYVSKGLAFDMARVVICMSGDVKKTENDITIKNCIYVESQVSTGDIIGDALGLLEAPDQERKRIIMEAEVD